MTYSAEARAENMRKAREALAARRQAGEAPEALSPTQQHVKNPKSRALAVAAKCYDCQGGDADPGWKWRIGNCVGTGCPLEPVRPYQQLLGKKEPVI